MGAVINSGLSVTLKRVLNHQRPVSGLRSDPGMPSSHAQSLFYAAVLGIISCESSHTVFLYFSPAFGS